MIALLQRVTSASVSAEKQPIASIRQGTLAFIAVEPSDDERICERFSARILGYRIFDDDEKRMNRSVVDICGGVLLVPQFTLAADTSRGMRPSFSGGATGHKAESLFLRLVAITAAKHAPVKAGRFGANMQVEMINDGPATFLLQSAGSRRCP